jgi:hydroxyacylglutathione hydrolase
MAFRLYKIPVGPWPMNTYIIVCEATGSMAIVDPGAEPDKILGSVNSIKSTMGFSSSRKGDLQMILITHGHPDHIGSLDKIKDETGAPIYIHPLDAELFDIQFDHPYNNNGRLSLGELTLTTIYTPGHTLGSTCIDLGDHRVIVGDTIFVDGPGKTWSALEFKLTITTMKSIVFTWPDDTTFFPGHGLNGRIGDERSKFESFIARGWNEDLYGDVTWE